MYLWGNRYFCDLLQGVKSYDGWSKKFWKCSNLQISLQDREKKIIHYVHTQQLNHAFRTHPAATIWTKYNILTFEMVPKSQKIGNLLDLNPRIVRKIRRLRGEGKEGKRGAPWFAECEGDAYWSLWLKLNRTSDMISKQNNLKKLKISPVFAQSHTFTQKQKKPWFLSVQVQPPGFLIFVCPSLITRAFWQEHTHRIDHNRQNFEASNPTPLRP